jgi:pullulanase
MRLLVRLHLALVFTFVFSAVTAWAEPHIPANHIRIHYHRPDAAYTGWTIYAFYDTTEDTGDYGGGPVQITGTDSYGVYFDVGVITNAQNVGLIIHNPTAAGGDQKDPGTNEFVDPSTEGMEYWAFSGIGKMYTSQPDLGNPTALLPGYARIHYYRPDGVYANWTVYAFDDTEEYTGDFNDGLTFPTNYDSYGPYFDIRLKSNPSDLGFIVHNVSTGTKDPGPDMHLAVNTYLQAWVISGDSTVYTTQPTPAQLLGAGFYKLQAFWIDRSTIAIQNGDLQTGGKYLLISSLTAGLKVTNTGVTGGTSVALTPGGSLSAAQLARFPQLATGYEALTLPTNLSAQQYLTLLRGQLAVSVQQSDGTLTYATGVQDAGVLDDLYAYTGRLGVIVCGPASMGSADCSGDGDAVLVRVWAPTAQSMNLELFVGEQDAAPAQTVAMTETNGVWTAKLDQSWLSHYYLLDEKVYAPITHTLVENVVTDPYSIDLALNGIKSRLTDVDADANKPAGWDEDVAPYLARINELTIYELHVRDFSVGDATVPAEHRGTYLAFTDAQTDGMKHLRQLAGSGLRAVHLLPTFHFNSVNEDKSTWQTTGDLSGFAPDSQEQQAAVAAIQSADAYNWGYDPDHYLAPEGSYAVNPDERVKEYREMVMGLHHAGLRVIQDVVFNHTSGFGEASNSILDEVVPSYYNRLDANGALETASCCADTATEHFMMGKLQQDAILWNAKKYKIDGFRFDIMSFTFISNLEQIKQALAQLTLGNDGIDGSKIYIYGEGFNFGETANSALGLNASQLNLYGYGIGSFNDRIRDGVRGGGPFDDERVQGFATGLFTDASNYTTQSTSLADQKATLLHRSDWIRVGLTGNLRDYSFVDALGKTITGGELDYQGQPTGYTASPIEAVNYVSVHDNQDIFDTIQVKAAEGDTAAIRARRQVLAMSLVALGQGIPFFQAGDDLLRSKDMDQNSYDSGDWFNKIDWSGEGNNWGIGLPIASQNSGQWFFEQPLLANAALKPTPAEIEATTTAFQDFLEIRASSPLFRMQTFAEVQRYLTFLNTGPSQIPGLIVMELQTHGIRTGPYGHVVVVFNGTMQEQTFTSGEFAGANLQLHPVQQRSRDGAMRAVRFERAPGRITVPALTTVVFVSPE